MVAIVEVPSDKKKILAKFRVTKKHAKDMVAVIKYLKTRPMFRCG